MKNSNPFPLFNYIGSKYFCDRIQETERIISAVTNQRNIALVSELGIGKTSLIKHIKEELLELENYLFYYVEFNRTENVTQFINSFLATLFNKEKINAKTKKYFPELNISIKKEKKTGNIRILIENNNLEYFFESLIKYLILKNKKIVFALDDIQKVIHYLTDYELAIFLKFLSVAENTSFVLSTNQVQILEILLGVNLKKTEIIELQKIEKKKYAKFIKKRFVKENIKIDKSSIEYILLWSKANTFYTHYICNKIFNTGCKKVTIEFVKQITQDILKEFNFIFIDYKNLLSEYQWKLLTAIAKEGNATQITSSDFIRHYKLNAPSSVKTAVNALIEKGLVIRKNNVYLIINTFLERWIIENSFMDY